jgi:hypothetical protein
MTRRSLPLLLERDTHEVEAQRFERAGAFEASVRDTAEDLGRVISCVVKCSACCSHPVGISILEGISLFRWLVERGLWTASLQAKLQTHSTQVWGLAHEVWFLSNIPCPLLSESKCSAHEGRPFVCRTTWSTGDPYDCHPHRFGPRTGIVPRADTIRDFHQMEASKLRQHVLKHIPLPISKALLLAERVCSGKLAIEDVQHTLLKEYGDVG